MEKGMEERKMTEPINEWTGRETDTHSDTIYKNELGTEQDT